MKSARIALQEAYSIFLGNPGHETTRRNDRKKLRQKPRRIVRDDSGAIISTPGPVCHATETFTGRTSTTHRCAVAISAGGILAAAESQPEIKSMWLQFAYNPYLDTNSTARNHLRAQLIPLIFGLWAFAPKSRRVDLDNPVRLVRLVDLSIQDCAIRFRTDRAPGDWDSWWRQLGYASPESAHWKRSWEPHAIDLYNVIDNLDAVSLRPVVALLRKREMLAEESAC